MPANILKEETNDIEKIIKGVDIMKISEKQNSNPELETMSNYS